MIKKPIKNLIQTAFILILGLVFTICTVSADTSKGGSQPITNITAKSYETNSESLKQTKQLVNVTLSIQDKEKSTSSNKVYKPLIGRKLTYWRISDALTGSADEIENKKISIVNDLRSMKYKDLVKKYGSPDQTSASDTGGVINLVMGKNSLYYFVEVDTNSSVGPYVAGFLVNVPLDSVGVIDVHSKNVYDIPPEPTDTGGKRFVKVDSSKGNKLAGAWFRVAIKKADGKYYSVKRSGVDYVVKSDKNGNFEVTGLELDKTYYLVEVKSPAGYSQLAGPVEFRVALSDSTQQTVQTISNKPNPYDRTTENTHNRGAGSGKSDGGGIVIPKTGDIMLLLLVVAGCLVSSLGVLMIRSDDKGLAS